MPRIIGVTLHKNRACHALSRRYSNRFSEILHEMYCSWENEILRGIFCLVSRFSQHLVLYLGNLDYLLNISCYISEIWIIFSTSRVISRKFGFFFAQFRARYTSKSTKAGHNIPLHPFQPFYARFRHSGYRRIQIILFRFLCYLLHIKRHNILWFA